MPNHQTDGTRAGPDATAMDEAPSPALLDWSALGAATLCLKTVAHPVRLRILELLLGGRYAVGELAELCEVDQPTISAHLGHLRDRGVLRQDRDGRNVYYRVADPGAIGGIVHCMRENFGSSRT